MSEGARNSYYDSVALLTRIARKHGHDNPGLYVYGGSGYGKGVDPSPAILIKASEQMKKVRDSLEHEIREFQETGEFSLAFKDVELEKRIADIEGRLNQSRAQMIAIEHLLTMLLDQRSPVTPSPPVEDVDEEDEEPEDNKIPMSFTRNDYDDFLCVFLPAVTVLMVALTYTLYHELRR